VKLPAYDAKCIHTYYLPYMQACPYILPQLLAGDLVMVDGDW
jgi:hypothetical protein